MVKRFQSKPTFAILEAVYPSNNEEVHSSDFYLVRGHWKLKDLQVDGKQVIYKGKYVECPIFEEYIDYEDVLSAEEFADLEISETPELRFVDDDWEDMFQGSTVDEIIITDEDYE